MTNDISDIIIDCNSGKLSDVSEEFRDYCEHSALMLKDCNTIALYSMQEFERLVEKAGNIGHTVIMRYLLSTSVIVDSYRELPKTLQHYVEHFWNQNCKTYHFVFKDGIYLLSKE